MIRTDQKGKWQLRAEVVQRFKTKKDMDKYAHENAVKIIQVIEFSGDMCYDRKVIAFNKKLKLV